MPSRSLAISCSFQFLRFILLQVLQEVLVLSLIDCVHAISVSGHLLQFPVPALHPPPGPPGSPGIVSHRLCPCHLGLWPSPAVSSSCASSSSRSSRKSWYCLSSTVSMPSRSLAISCSFQFLRFILL